MALAEQERPDRLAAALPVAGAPQPPLPADFAAALRDFCLGHRHELLRLTAGHRYQMSEPARCEVLGTAYCGQGGVTTGSKTEAIEN